GERPHVALGVRFRRILQRHVEELPGHEGEAGRLVELEGHGGLRHLTALSQLDHEGRGTHCSLASIRGLCNNAELVASPFRVESSRKRHPWATSVVAVPAGEGRAGVGPADFPRVASSASAVRPLRIRDRRGWYPGGAPVPWDAQRRRTAPSRPSLRSGGGRVDATGAWLVGAKGEYPINRNAGHLTRSPRLRGRLRQ